MNTGFMFVKKNGIGKILLKKQEDLSKIQPYIVNISGAFNLPHKILLTGWGGDQGDRNINGEYTFLGSYNLNPFWQNIYINQSVFTPEGISGHPVIYFNTNDNSWKHLSDDVGWDNSSTNPAQIPLTGWQINNAQGPATNIIMTALDKGQIIPNAHRVYTFISGVSNTLSSVFNYLELKGDWRDPNLSMRSNSIDLLFVGNPEYFNENIIDLNYCYYYKTGPGIQNSGWRNPINTTINHANTIINDGDVIAFIPRSSKEINVTPPAIIRKDTKAEIFTIDSVTLSPKRENLIYLFDPAHYNGWISTPEPNIALSSRLATAKAYLNDTFHKYKDIVPQASHVISEGNILNKINDPNYLERKAYFCKNNHMFCYEKDQNNNDIEFGSKSMRNVSQIAGVKERKKALLRLISPKLDTFNLFQQKKSKTFSCFIKLKGPTQHRSANNYSKIIREKKGIFLNTGQFSIGYRSPHYYRNGQTQSYKFIFEPFSLVFSIQDNARNHTFMTDFKFQFNQLYHLLITIECGLAGEYNEVPTKVKIHVNGQQEDTAYLHFNPLIQGNPGVGGFFRKKQSRIENSPIQPGFYKYDGSIYPSQNQHTIQVKIGNKNSTIGWNNLYLGKSNIAGGGNVWNTYTPDLARRIRSGSHMKRYLNNIEVGVIHIYSSVLSNDQIQSIYNIFGSRYQ